MRRDFYRHIHNELDSLKSKGTYKHFKYNTNALNSTINVEGLGEKIVLCSNNYLGLANKAEIIKAALTKVRKELIAVTDDCMAVELLGFPIRITEGSRRNIKITTSEDIAIAEAMLKCSM